MQRSSGYRTEEVLRAPSDGSVVEQSSSATAEEVEQSLRLIEELKFFLTTAPVNWQENQVIRRYYLNNDQGFISCVFWNNLYYITGTDIVKCCMYRMQQFGRQIVQRKKFEEGIFSDLRNLKCGVDATLEQPKSDFLAFLFRNMCLKTQKKQKVFFWFSVPHDKLFADALERDLKREQGSQSTTSVAVNEPALSFKYDFTANISLFEQLLQHVESRQSTIAENKEFKDDIESNDSIDLGIKLEQHPNGTHDSSIDMQHMEKDKEGEQEPVQERNFSPLSSELDSTGEFSKQTLVVEPSVLTTSGDKENQQVPSVNDAREQNIELDDFPLDYFPVEIEYPNGDEMGFEALQNIPSGPLPADSFQPPNTYEATMEEPFATTAMLNKFSYGMNTPIGWPLSATKSHFITNGEYYARNRSVTPNDTKLPKEPIVSPQTSSKTSKIEETNVQEPIDIYSAYPQYMPASYAPFYPMPNYYAANQHPAYFPDNARFGPDLMSCTPNEAQMPSLENMEDNLFTSPDAYNWRFYPPPPAPAAMSGGYRPYMSYLGGHTPLNASYPMPSTALPYSFSPSSAYYANFNLNRPQTQQIQQPSQTGNEPQNKQNVHTKQRALYQRWRHFQQSSQPTSSTKYHLSKNGKIRKPRQVNPIPPKWNNSVRERPEIIQPDAESFRIESSQLKEQESNIDTKTTSAPDKREQENEIPTTESDGFLNE